jgi:hypothetical protein
VVQFTLIRPILDNKRAFKDLFIPAGTSLVSVYGDIGDAAHLKGSGDHTPWASDVIFGLRHLPGFVYAQDLHFQGRFNSDDVLPWLNFQLGRGKYPEVKYRIGRLVLRDRRYNWRKQKGRDDKHLHLSYMPGFERSPSTLIRDLDAWMRAGKPGLDAMSTNNVAQPSEILRRANIQNGGPLPIPAGITVGAYSARPLREIPYYAWAPLSHGYGGPESAQQAGFVDGLHKLAVDVYRTGMIPVGERQRSEVGSGTIGFAHMIVTAKAGMRWTNDPGVNGSRLGFALGAPLNW